MKKIFFCCLLMGCAALLKAQSSPVPMRTSDPAPLVTAVKPSLPMRSGGGSAAAVSRPQALPMRGSDGGAAPALGKAQALPMRSGDGGGGGSTAAPGLLNPALNGTNAANTKPLRPSDLAVKQDSLQKH